MPSFVGLSETAGCWSASRAQPIVLYPERTIRSIKRRMGEDVKVRLGDQEFAAGNFGDDLVAPPG